MCIVFRMIGYNIVVDEIASRRDIVEREILGTTFSGVLQKSKLFVFCVDASFNISFVLLGCSIVTCFHLYGAIQSLRRKRWILANARRISVCIHGCILRDDKLKLCYRGAVKLLCYSEIDHWRSRSCSYGM